MRDARGVVVSELGAPARIEPIHVDDPGPGEVLVRVVANGVCHSDLWAIQNGN
jgi:S-(hydroxymethyl)mycothiol dehydrogenase